MANPYIKSIIQEAAFNQNIFGEEIEYNGVKIIALPQLGESEKQDHPAFMQRTNTVSVGGVGFFTVKQDDVPNPKVGDKISYEGQEYFVGGKYSVDSVAKTFTLRVTFGERGYMTRR